MSIDRLIFSLSVYYRAHEHDERSTRVWNFIFDNWHHLENLTRPRRKHGQCRTFWSVVLFVNFYLQRISTKSNVINLSYFFQIYRFASRLYIDEYINELLSE